MSMQECSKNIKNSLKLGKKKPQRQKQRQTCRQDSDFEDDFVDVEVFMDQFYKSEKSFMEFFHETEQSSSACPKPSLHKSKSKSKRTKIKPSKSNNKAKKMPISASFPAPSPTFESKPFSECMHMQLSLFDEKSFLKENIRSVKKGQDKGKAKKVGDNIKMDDPSVRQFSLFGEQDSSLSLNGSVA